MEIVAAACLRNVAPFAFSTTNCWGLLTPLAARISLARLRRSLHPILKQLGVEKAGFHATRRFRTTWLRKQRAPEDLIKFWLGHAKQSVTDAYSKLADDEEFRKQVAEKVGTGFEVPAYDEQAVTPMALKNTEERTVAISA